ncbi:MAG: crossover junction endodeoxyribonuclease RuvC [Leadbetterella sp.]
METKVKEKIILGVDPGTRIMGYGVISVKGNQLSIIQYGVIRLEKYPSHEMKLKKIFERIVQIITEYLPDEMAIEAPFYGENVQSMLKLGRAQGVAMAAALSREIPIVEYLPKKVKQSVSGNGNASKEQVAYMLEKLFNVSLDKSFFDATDAVAVAVCHYMHKGIKKGTANSSKKNNWSAFLAENPDKLKK